MSRFRRTMLVTLSVLWLMLMVTYVVAVSGKPVNIDRIRFPEPSGATYHTGRRTLFVVGDEGDICEIRTDGEPVKRGDLAKGGRRDLEGVTFDPATGLLYVAVEGEERILEVDPDKLGILREFKIPRTWQGKTVLKPGGQGIEAIAFLPDAKHPHGGTFLVTNQGFKNSPAEDASALLRLEVPLRGKPGADARVKIVSYVRMRVFDLSGLCYDTTAKRLYAISDSGNRIFEMTPEGKIRKHEALVGQNQEGIAVDPRGFLYIAQDTGGILKLRLK